MNPQQWQPGRGKPTSTFGFRGRGRSRGSRSGLPRGGRLWNTQPRSWNPSPYPWTDDTTPTLFSTNMEFNSTPSQQFSVNENHSQTQAGFVLGGQQIPQLHEIQFPIYQYGMDHNMSGNLAIQPVIQTPLLPTPEFFPQTNTLQDRHYNVTSTFNFANSGTIPLNQRFYDSDFDTNVPQPARFCNSRFNGSFLQPRLTRPFKRGRGRGAPARPVHLVNVKNQNVTLGDIQNQVTTVPRKVLPAPEIPKRLYHYTTLKNLDSILRDKALYPKDQPDDIILPTARFGKGIYFTALDFNETTENILKNNYGAGKAYLSQARKTEVCFEFLSELLPRLVFCEDLSCLAFEGKEHARKIWMVDSEELQLETHDGFYYIRELNGLGKPKNVTKKRWNDE